MRNRPLATLTVAAALLVAVLGPAGCATNVSGTAQPATSPTSAERQENLVAGTALESLLLSERGVALITGGQRVQTLESYATMPEPPTGTYSDPACTPTLVSALTSAYPRSSGYVDVRGRMLRDSSEEDSRDYTQSADQAVVAFDTAEAARKFMTLSQRTWVACQGHTVVAPVADGTHDTWRIEQVKDEGGVLSMTATLTSPTGAPWSCQHALAAEGNVIIDVNVSMADVRNTAELMTNAIRQRFSQ